MKPADRDEQPIGGGRRWRRRAVRWASLALSLGLVLPLAPWPQATLVVPALSPFVAAGSLLAGAKPTVFLVAPALVAAVCLYSRRFFCRYLCPTGLLLDCAGCASYRKLDVRRVPRFGDALVVSTWAGAACGFPLFLWLDPLSLFSGLFGNRYHDWLWLAPVGVLAISIALPRIWCTRICPLGATQDLLKWPADLWRAWGRKPLADSGGEAPPSEPRARMRRRAVLASAALAITAGAGAWLGGRFRKLCGTPVTMKLRPPGAVEEQRFVSLCIRCGNCLQACPAAILQADLNPDQLVSIAAPVVDFQSDYCREDCHACTQVCPSGAIQRLSLTEKLTHKIGLAAFEFDLCLLAYDRECEICKRVCPQNAVSFAWSEEEYTVTPQLDAERCNGCGACLVACPGKNDWEREADPAVPVRKAIAIA